MKKGLIALFVILLLAFGISACGSTTVVTHFEVCPQESGIIGPCSQTVETFSLTEKLPSETYTFGSQHPNAIVSVQGGGWIKVDCSPLVNSEETTFKSSYLIVNSSSEVGSCTISADVWPKYQKIININITSFGK